MDLEGTHIVQITKNSITGKYQVTYTDRHGTRKHGVLKSFK